LREEQARHSSIAPVRLILAKNEPASKPRSGNTSMPGPSSGSSRVASAISSRSVTEPTVAPSRARVPVSTSAISRSVGYPAQLIR
jgi:hypothetical protein